MSANGWLTAEHPIYTLKKAEWTTNERRFRGGSGVLSELQPFDWETVAGVVYDRSQEYAIQLAAEARLASGATLTHYAQRQNRATYINFPESFASLLIGHLMRQSPEKDDALNFGELGEVQRDEGVTLPSRAELVYYNTDGVGNDGSQWDNFWTGVGKWSMATGHRWVMVEASRIKPASFADEMNGRRPYLLNYSPLEVPNWHFDEGQLQFAVIKFRYREPRLDAGSLAGNAWATGYRLLVRTGFLGFGTTYEKGGWWDFDKGTDPIPGREGNWEGTRGQIPMWLHFYERDKDELSRSGCFELGQAAVAYMNMASAADFDAWDAAQSHTFILGVTSEQFNVPAAKVAAGAKIIPVPGDRESKTVPGIYDSSAGAVAATVFQSRLDSIRAIIREIASLETSGGPDASGLSKQMGFLDTKSPRLRLLASEFESSQMTALHFLELRNGFAQPQGGVTWPRDFDLAPMLDNIERFLDVVEKAGAMSPLLTARALARAAQETGLVSDDEDIDEIEDGIRLGIEAEAVEKARDAEALKDLPEGDEDEPDATPPAADLPAGNIETSVALVLNGAQITAAVDIVAKVTAGEIPRDTGVQMLQAFFNITPEQAEKIMGTAGTKTPTTPNPNPAAPSGGPTPPIPPAPPAQDRAA